MIAITLDTENAALRNADDDEINRQAVAKILRKAIDEYVECDSIAISLYDDNGNRVGEFSVYN